MSGGWKRIRLEDALEALIDYRGKTPNKTTSGIPLITAKIVKNGFIQEPNEFIAAEDYDSWMVRGFPKIGDVVLTMEAPLGEVAQINDERVALAQRIVTLRGKEGLLDNTYLKYFFKSEIGQSRLKERETGTTVTGIKQSELRLVEIDVPPLSTQRCIATILSELDEKIELNRQTNQTLEAIAQALFKEWFVDFNFPGATGRMQESELGPIPVGWKVRKLGEVCDVNKKALSKNDGLEWIEYIEISGVNKGVINETTRYDLGKEPSRAKRKISHGDTVLSTVRPDRGSYFLAINPPSSHIASTGFAVFSATKVPFTFLYIFLTDLEKLEYYGHIADGGAYPAINPNLIMDMDIIIPDEIVLREFNSRSESIFEKMHIYNQQSKQLSQLRDTLLPKLMNGEIAVRATE
jgi:type I restriction enzyme S subunit